VSLFLLDTDTLTLLQPQNARVIAQIAAHTADTIDLTIVTVEEQLTGRLAVLRAAKTPADVVDASELLGATVVSLAAFPHYHPSAASLATLDQLLAAKLNVRTSDLRIASIALAEGATLVTRNRRDFTRVPGLTIADWAA
jgi:tRNA(fMet)-specific endonuclease VapC